MRFGPISIDMSLSWWRFLWHSPGQRVGIFRNRHSVIPGRWGFYIMGIEVGSRNPGNRFGVWLKKNGLWPW